MKSLKHYQAKINNLRNSENILLRWFYSIYRLCVNVVKIIISESYRGQYISRVIYKKHFHQISHYTEINRHPDLFSICKDYLKENSRPKILSFGCSTGEEVYTLQKYIPAAEIIGVDISKWCIKVCKKKFQGQGLSFMHTLSGQFRKETDFNAIFCLAVFQHPENRNNKNNEYSTKYLFQNFEDQLELLDKKLKPHGLLIIDNCDFNFTDTIIAANYYPLDTPGNLLLQDRPLFDKSNCKVSNTTNNYRVYVKLANVKR
jgi:SAM-dependent methyltransferase